MIDLIMDLILGQYYLNQIITTIDLWALKLNSFFIKGNAMVSIIPITVKLGWVSIHMGLVSVRGLIGHGVSPIVVK